MRAFLLSLSGKTQAFVIISATLILAFVSAAFCGLFFDNHQLVTNTELIASVYQVMGTIYAILLTFTLWGVWQSFTDANKSVQNEAHALLDLVHMLEAYPHKKSDALHKAALDYVKTVVDIEWPLLQKGKGQSFSHIGQCDSTIPIIQAVQTVSPSNEKETVIFSKTLTLLTRWLDARRTRILIAEGDSVKALWPLLMIGAIILFAFHGLFVAKTLAIWITLLFGTSLVIGVTFFLIFSLDCPFAGSLSIDAEPFVLTNDLLKSRERFTAADNI